MRKSGSAAKKNDLFLFRSSEAPIFRSSFSCCLWLPSRRQRPRAVRLDGSLLEAVNIGQYFGHGTVEILRDRLIHIDRFIQ